MAVTRAAQTTGPMTTDPSSSNPHEASPPGAFQPPHQRLREAAARLNAEAVSLAELARLQGSAGLGSLLLVLAAPCVLPVPGVGNVMGLALMMLAVPIWRGDPVGALPARVAAFQMPARWARRALLMMAWLYERAARFARGQHGLGSLTQAGPRPWMAALVALMGALIFLPLPLGNVLPALCMAMLGLGLALRDGLLLLYAWAAGLLACIYSAALGLAAWHWGLAPVWRYLGADAG